MYSKIFAENYSFASYTDIAAYLIENHAKELPALNAVSARPGITVENLMILFPRLAGHINNFVTELLNRGINLEELLNQLIPEPEEKKHRAINDLFIKILEKNIVRR